MEQTHLWLSCYMKPYSNTRSSCSRTSQLSGGVVARFAGSTGKSAWRPAQPAFLQPDPRRPRLAPAAVFLRALAPRPRRRTLFLPPDRAKAGVLSKTFSPAAATPRGRASSPHPPPPIPPCPAAPRRGRGAGWVAAGLYCAVGAHRGQVSQRGLGVANAGSVHDLEGYRLWTQPGQWMRCPSGQDQPSKQTRFDVSSQKRIGSQGTRLLLA